MELENNERVLLLGLVKEAIRQAQSEKSPQYSFDGKKYTKSRKKYGIKTLTTLYEIETKLKKLRISDVISSLTLEDMAKIVNAFTDIKIPIEAVKEEIELNYL